LRQAILSVRKSPSEVGVHLVGSLDVRNAAGIAVDLDGRRDARNDDLPLLERKGGFGRRALSQPLSEQGNREKEGDREQHDSPPPEPESPRALSAEVRAHGSEFSKSTKAIAWLRVQLTARWGCAFRSAANSATRPCSRSDS